IAFRPCVIPASTAYLAKVTDFLPGFSIPYFRGVPTARSHTTAIGTKIDTGHWTTVATKAHLFRMAQPLEVMPLPITKLFGALVQDSLGSADVVCQPLVVRQIDAVEIRRLPHAL